MKIDQIQVYLVNIDNRNIPIIFISTDNGIHGIGEAYSVGPDLATIRVVEYFSEWLIGHDPFDIEGICKLLFAGSRFPGGSIVNAAISGIEHALWDIKGKALGVPVYQLIGGKCRNKVRVYKSVKGDTPDILAENAIKTIEKYGFTAIKISPFPDCNDTLWCDMGVSNFYKKAEARIRAVRKVVGDDVDIALDAHARCFEPSISLTLCKIFEPYRPFFLEEPIRPENKSIIGYLRSKSLVPIATGEALYTKFEFHELLNNNGADIIQPDITLTGGLWEMKKIAAIAEASYVSVAPHNPCGPIATAVNLHFALSTHNFIILEYKPDDISERCELIEKVIEFHNGYLIPPVEPGLGVKLNIKTCSKQKYRSWHRPFLWRKDGSIGYQ